MYQKPVVPVLEKKSRKRILLVEDNDTNRWLLSELLKSWGHEVFSISDGIDFFSALSGFSPHIILLDLKLPTVDGYTLLQQLQDYSKWRNTPVIVLSALSFAADRERAMQLGARHYLVKPVSLKQLRQLLDWYFTDLDLPLGA